MSRKMIEKDAIFACKLGYGTYRSKEDMSGFGLFLMKTAEKDS